MEDYKPSKLVVGAIVISIIIASYFFITISYGRFTQPQKDIITVGTNTPFPPFEYMQGNNVVGFDIELADKIGEKLNRKVVIKDFSDFASLFPALETGTIDVAISGITITSDRENIVNFSEPYYNTSQAILSLKKGNISKNLSGKIVAYQELTTSQTWVENNINMIDAKENVSFSDLNTGLQSLRFGTIDVIILDESVANTLVKNYNDLTILEVINTDEKYGVAVKQNDPQKILPKVNGVINEMKQNGEYDNLVHKYFGGN